MSDVVRLRARVRRVTGATRHYDGATSVELPSPSAVEIEPAEGAFFLLYLDEKGECLTDTWHQSLAEAKAQAQFEFGIEDSDWVELRS